MEPSKLTEIRRLLVIHFSLSELQTLCFDLGVDHENLPGSTKDELARELIRYLNRKKQLERLAARCLEYRPEVEWPDLPDQIATDSTSSFINRQTLSRMWRGVEPGKRKILLEKVKNFWIDGVLVRSFNEQCRLAVSWKRQTRFVDQPWDELAAEVYEGGNHDGSDSIYEAFVDADRSLLILGDPGSGKTMILLQLAQALIAEAENDPSGPVPVVLNLVSWDSGRGAFGNWVVEELSTKYHIPQNIGRVWLEGDDLLLLLDGLDEVPFDRQDDCVQTINRFRAERGLTGLVVCSRTKPYESIGIQLKFGGAILLSPLSDEQIGRYLDNQQVSHRQLKQALALDGELQEMARSPLLLNLMNAIYKDDEDLTDSGLTARVEARSFRKQLFADYTQQMFRGRNKEDDQSEITEQLSFIAQKLDQHNQTIFLIDQLQPSWLPSRSWQRLYMILSRIASGLVVGVTLWLGFISFTRFDPDFSLRLVEIFTDLIPLAFPWNVLLFEMLVHVGLGSVTGIVDILLFDYWEKRPNIKERQRRILHLAVICLTVGILSFGFTIAVDTFLNAFLSMFSEVISFFVLYYLVHGHSYKRDIYTAEPVRFHWAGALKGLAVGLVIGFLAGLITMDTSQFLFMPLVFLLVVGFSGKAVEAETRPNQGIRQSIYNGILAIFIGGIVLGAYSFYVYDYSIFAGLLAFVNIGLIAGFAFGMGSAGKHIMLRLMLRWSRQVPWDFEALLDQAAGLLLIHRVGGGYMFIHRLMQEYFAARILA